MIRLTALLAFLSAFAVASAGPSPTPPGDDIYSPGRALVADIDRIVTPNGVDETFEVVLGGASGGQRLPRLRPQSRMDQEVTTAGLPVSETVDRFEVVQTLDLTGAAQE